MGTNPVRLASLGFAIVMMASVGGIGYSAFQEFAVFQQMLEEGLVRPSFNSTHINLVDIKLPNKGLYPLTVELTLEARGDNEVRTYSTKPVTIPPGGEGRLLLSIPLMDLQKPPEGFLIRFYFAFDPFIKFSGKLPFGATYIAKQRGE